jgi:SulP family sulfate permease
VAVETATPLLNEDQPDHVQGDARERYDPAQGADRDIVICRISGAFFFGAAASVSAALDRIGEQPKAVIFDFSAVPILDSTAAATIEAFVRKAHKRRGHVVIAAATDPVQHALEMLGVRQPAARFAVDLQTALVVARAAIKPPLTGA